MFEEGTEVRFKADLLDTFENPLGYRKFPAVVAKVLTETDASGYTLIVEFKGPLLTLLRGYQRYDEGTCYSDVREWHEDPYKGAGLPTKHYGLYVLTNEAELELL